MESRKKRLKYTLILYLIIFLVLLVAEFILQCTGVESNRWYRLTSIFPEGALTIVNEKENFDRRKALPLCITDPVLFWKMAPNRTGSYMETARVVTNSFGFRSPEITPRKPPGTYRILCLGDSATFGLCVGQNETYPAHLQHLLRAAYPSMDIEVINTGVPGYSSHQGRVAAHHYIEKFDPDLVTFALGINDLAGSGRLTDAEWHRWNMGPDRRLSFVFRRSELYTFLERFLVFLKKQVLGVFSGGAGVPQGVPHRVPLDDYEDNIRDITRLCSDKGIDIILIREAVNKEPWLEMKIKKMERQLEIMQGIAGGSGAAVVDLWSVMENVEEIPENRTSAREETSTEQSDIIEETQGEILERLNLAEYHPFFVDHFHPNAEGNRIIAEALEDAVRLTPSFKESSRRGSGKS